MVRLTCFSDTHGKHRELDSWFAEHSGDILLYAGDYQKNSLDDGLDFLNWFSELPFSKKVLCFGNHDSNYEYVMDEAKRKKDVVVLKHDYMKIMGLKIFCSPYSVRFGSWSFMHDEAGLEQLYKEIPQSTNILVSHTPAYLTLDRCSNGWSAGSVSLKERVQELSKLKYLVCGHIHEGYGMAKKNGVTYVNASSLDEKYHYRNEPVSFTY